MKTKERELIEAVYSAPTVERDSGVIKGVKILGRTSRNNREYTMRALQESAVLSEGIKVHINHDRTGKERKIGDFFGVMRDVRTKEDGNYGDLHFVTKHPLTESVLERAERFPDSFGMSPHAYGPTRIENGKQIVESVARMRSVDIVDTPATTSSLYESEEQTVRTKFKEYVRQIPKGTWGKKTLTELAEEVEGVADVMVEAPADASPEADDQVKAAFRAMVVAAFDDESLDAAATIARIKDILKAQEKLVVKPAEPEPEPEEEPEPTESPEEEEAIESSELGSLKRLVNKLTSENKCRELLESAGVKSDNVKLLALSALKSDSDRAELIESWVKPAKSRKPLRSSPKTEADDMRSWNTGAEFIQSIANLR